MGGFPSRALRYLLREHERLFREYQRLHKEYESLPVPTGPSAAHIALINKVRHFSLLLANHRLALRYKRDGLI